jgi:hypothetical protein
VTKFGKYFYGDKCKSLNVKGHGEASGRDRSCHLWKADNCGCRDKCKFVHDKEHSKGKTTSEAKKTGARGADDESDSVRQITRPSSQFERYDSYINVDHGTAPLTELFRFPGYCEIITVFLEF